MTALCVAVVVGSLFAVGVPLAWLLGGRRPLAEGDCIRAPFLGLAAIVLVLQNLVYLDVPLRQSTPWLWAAVLLAWLALAASGRWRECLRPALGLAAGGFLALYLLQGAGMIRLGAAQYVGRCWVDQFNYVATAQSLMDEPVSVPLADAENRPLTALTFLTRQDRLGQSVLHAFYAASCRWDAKSLFEPTILLLPPLAGLALFALGRRLGMGRVAAALTAAGAALLPSLTLLHLESFLSHALGLPFLLLFPLLVADVAEQPRWGTFLTAAMCLTAAISIYTEFTLVLAGLLVLVLAGTAIAGGQWRMGLACLAGLAVAPAVLLPGYVPHWLPALRRMGAAACEGVYPWALKLEGLGRLWFGDLPFFARRSVLTASQLGGAALTLVALIGLGLACRGKLRALRQKAAGESRAAAALSVALVLLALLPAAVVLRDREHPYQVYKLLITVSPLLVLGVVLAVRSSVARWPKVVLAGVAAAALVGTADMLWRSTHAEQVPRTIAWMLLDPNMTAAAHRLEQESGSDMLIATADVTSNPWLAYYARHNRIWFNCAEINRTPEAAWPPQHLSMFHLAEVPPSCLVLASKFPALDVAPPAGARLEWANDAYQLWRTTGRTWALPTAFRSSIAPEHKDGRPFFWMGVEPVTLEVIAGCPTTLSLRGKVVAGPFRGPAGPAWQLVISTDHGWATQLQGTGCDLALDVPLPAGKTVLTLSIPETFDLIHVFQEHFSAEVLGLDGLRLSWTPQGGSNTAPARPDDNPLSVTELRLPGKVRSRAR
jgi:hypothetical protein